MCTICFANSAAASLLILVRLRGGKPMEKRPSNMNLTSPTGNRQKLVRRAVCGVATDITQLKRLGEMQAALARERELFAQQRATELAKANEALRGCLDALASVPELDDFLGQVMAAITRQLGAVASTLRLRNFEQNTLPLEIIFQSGRVMTPDEAKYPECWQSVTLERFDHNFLYHSAGKRTKNEQWLYLCRTGIRTGPTWTG
jgi:hypothetical protein